jgi:hypothetical protein
MSYNKVKSICIDEDEQKVWITSAENNVRPLTYSREVYPYFTNLLRNEGREAVEIALLKSYEEGNLQEGKNKFTKALKILRYVLGEEYSKFNWNNFSYEQRDKERELRESQEFKDLLKKALDYTLPNPKWVITKVYDGEVVYGKRCKTCMKWTRFKEKATKFDFELEAKDHIYNAYKDDWKVEKLE